ncbi:trimethylamine---corrinoid protein Co-methyltransferase [Dethiosulfatibacter aminovorans DSM 17477]|uniref:Trimethylamine---corrinoid protein Co-methyltransferase n=1 Tax=Dethiosulfatibacter aminovorans DSM 17477 TaxID=1121476 RepID=A0A1M6M3J0_9FIRM|nr:trimethylamine methyltransferase family protein [Dethiosulfatibacter aminovorans]SHJ77985.1 trimethylamine---corrinoid protein Co-methyltransferase [Dethiosulfatibacter aminovorans DSM 17477]
MEKDLKKLHDATMKILNRTGIRLMHPEIINLVGEKGVRVEGDRAFFTEDQIMDWISKAPEKFTLYARNPEHDMEIGGDNIEYAPGYGCSAIIDSEGQTKDAVMEDYMRFSKIVHESKWFKINGGILVQPSDIDYKNCLPVMMYSAMVHSDKCIMGVPGEKDEIEGLMELFSIAFGGKDEFMRKPRVITLISTTSPLQIDGMSLCSMIECIKHNQPIIITPGPMAGSNGPITTAGNIALGNAEVLVGIAVSQMLKEGTPVVYGMVPATADMQTGGISIGSPAWVKQSAYSARLAKEYGLPNRSGGTVNDAKGVSVQSGYESMLAMFVCHQEKANFVLHSAGILDGYGAISYEQFMIDLEIISMLDYYFKDLEIDDETLALDVIHEVGPGGEFLTSPHTFRNCRTSPWLPEISLRGLRVKESNKELIEKTIKKTEKMIEAYSNPGIDEAIVNNMIDHLIGLGIDSEIIEGINASAGLDLVGTSERVV